MVRLVPPARGRAIGLPWAHDSRVAQRGQATIELLAVLPLLMVASLAAAAILAHQTAGDHADEAAQAGAMALLQEEDPRDAARAALPRELRREARVALAGRRVTVTLPPPRPIHVLLPRLGTRATASAGPEPAP